MKAILTYTTMIDGKAVEKTRLFDTTPYADAARRVETETLFKCFLFLPSVHRLPPFRIA